MEINIPVFNNGNYHDIIGRIEITDPRFIKALEHGDTFMLSPTYNGVTHTCYSVSLIPKPATPKDETIVDGVLLNKNKVIVEQHSIWGENGVYVVKTCKVCNATESVRWWKCCPEHTDEYGPEVVCEECKFKLHPNLNKEKILNEITYIQD